VRFDNGQFINGYSHSINVALAGIVSCKRELFGSGFTIVWLMQHASVSRKQEAMRNFPWIEIAQVAVLRSMYSSSEFGNINLPADILLIQESNWRHGWKSFDFSARCSIKHDGKVRY
jgi:hypothetical protein